MRRVDAGLAAAGPRCARHEHRRLSTHEPDHVETGQLVDEGARGDVGLCDGVERRQLVDELPALDTVAQSNIAARTLVDELAGLDVVGFVGGQPAVLVPGTARTSSSQSGIYPSHSPTRMETSP